MKPAVHYGFAALSGMIGSVIVIGAAVAYPNLSMGLPRDCFNVDTKGPAQVMCQNVSLSEIVENRKVREAPALELSGVTLGKNTSLAALAHLGDLTIVEPMDPDALAPVVASAPNVRHLSVENPDLAKLNVSVHAVSITHHGELAEAPPSMQKIHPDFGATELSSAVLYDLSAKSAAGVEKLEVRGTVTGDHVDLRRYTKLKTLDLTVERDAKVTLPEHLSQNKNLKITEHAGGTTYSI